MKKMVVAGGCFWGVEAYYQRLNGVLCTKVGYAQGHKDNPSYQEVKKQVTGHVEVVEIEYDENIISLTNILEHLFRFIDPFTLNKQADDVGEQYRTGVYYIDDNDIAIIKNFIEEKQKQFDQLIVVEVEKLKIFYDAEEYHQNYLVKNSTGYCHVDFSLINDDELKPQYRKLK